MLAKRLVSELSASDEGVDYDHKAKANVRLRVYEQTAAHVYRRKFEQGD